MLLSAITVYTQSFTSRLKAERRGKKDTCMGRMWNAGIGMDNRVGAVEGNFTGERTTFHPTSRSGKGFSALGERWKQYS
jgi:hypothetical protein